MKVTGTPATGLSLASKTFTDGATGTAVPAVAVWLSPASLIMRAARDAVPVAVKVVSRFAGAPLPTGRAVAVCVPVAGPNTHCADATPLASVFDVVGTSVPDPLADAKSTR